MQSSDVYYINGEEKASAFLAKPGEGIGYMPGVILVHGMRSSNKGYIPIAQELARNGIVGLAINLRGHGSSQGDFDKLTVNDGLSDALNAYDFLLSQGVDPTRVGFCGASLGSAIGVLLSKRREIKSMVLRAPATYTEELMETVYPNIMLEEVRIFPKMTELEKTPPYEAISNFKGNLLVVASGEDEVIPPQISNGYITAAKQAKIKELLTIKDATHALINPEWRVEFIIDLMRWFKTTL